MREEPLLLDKPAATTSLHFSESQIGKAAAELCLRNLNPAFVAATGLVGLDRSADRLTVGAAEPLSLETRSALHFATGLEIVCVNLSSNEILAHRTELATDFEPPVPTTHAPVMAVGETGETSSLFELLTNRFDGASHSLSPYEPLTKLLDAGHNPREAGEILLQGNYHGLSSRRAATVVAERLVQGLTLLDAGRETGAFPVHVQFALSASRTDANQPSIFVCLTKFEAEREREAAIGRFAWTETVILWASLALTWFQLFGWAGIPILTAGCWLAMRLLKLSARNRMNNMLRADILKLISRLERLDITPRSSIQAGMMRLEMMMPTWGRLPDTREGLANALTLPQLSRALLMKGDLKLATQRLADSCALEGTAAMKRCLRISRLSALTGFAVALAMLTG